MPGQPSSRQNLQFFHRRGAFQASLCATPRARRYDAHAEALLYIYMYVKALALRYGIWGTPRVIWNEKRQNKPPRASADSTPILTDQQPSSGSFGQTMVVRVSRRVGNTSKENICRPGSLPMRARLGTMQKCRGNVRPWHTFKRHRSCRPLHFKHGKGQCHPKKAHRACLRWMDERPIAFSQASCPYFPIYTRFLMLGQPSSRQNLQNFHRRGAFQAFLCATPGGRRFDAHARAFLYIYAEALILGYSIRGTPLVSSGTIKDKMSCLGRVRTAHRF